MLSLGGVQEMVRRMLLGMDSWGNPLTGAIVSKAVLGKKMSCFLFSYDGGHQRPTWCFCVSQEETLLSELGCRPVSGVLPWIKFRVVLYSGHSLHIQVYVFPVNNSLEMDMISKSTVAWKRTLLVHSKSGRPVQNCWLHLILTKDICWWLCYEMQALPQNIWYMTKYLTYVADYNLV